MFLINPIDQAAKEVDDAKIALEEINECGDLEDRLEAAQELEDAEARLLQARLNYPYQS
jgi:hypothetical protein